ncbi:MAG TPA: hypothetical protein VIY52_13430 [Streptosporangiaceae bacterium]
MALDRYRDGFLAALSADRLPTGDVPAAQSYRKPVMSMSELKVSPDRAAELRSKLEEIMDYLNDQKAEDPDGVPMNVLIGYYVPSNPGGR